MYSFLADIALVAHLAFIAFVLLGGLLLLRWPRLLWLHLTAMIWGVLIELTGWVCPLTPLENYFLARSGGETYQGGFIGHYLLPLIYPADLTPAIRLLLAGAVVMFNILVYSRIIREIKKRRLANQHSAR